MQRSVSPAMIAVAVVVLIVVAFVAYKFTLGKAKTTTPEGTVPQPGQYGGGMPAGQSSGAPAGGPAENAAGQAGGGG